MRHLGERRLPVRQIGFPLHNLAKVKALTITGSDPQPGNVLDSQPIA
jgi:hypothetical protein